MNASDEFYFKYKEPYQGCLLALRYIVMKLDGNIHQEIRYQIPYFTYKGKKLAILWVSGKKLLFGFVTDKSILPMVNGKKPRNRYEMIEIDPNGDLPKEMITKRLQQKIKLYEEFK
jgi:hypothetical protein